MYFFKIQFIEPGKKRGAPDRAMQAISLALPGLL
jgi:hypothetical protein